MDGINVFSMLRHVLSLMEVALCFELNPIIDRHLAAVAGPVLAVFLCCMVILNSQAQEL
jgi:hypothetical protein